VRSAGRMQFVLWGGMLYAARVLQEWSIYEVPNRRAFVSVRYRR
jgi:hypothetical protein